MKVKNARTVYDFECPVCHKSLVYQTTDNISGKTNRHLSISNCAVCKCIGCLMDIQESEVTDD